MTKLTVVAAAVAAFIGTKALATCTACTHWTENGVQRAQCVNVDTHTPATMSACWVDQVFGSNGQVISEECNGGGTTAGTECNQPLSVANSKTFIELALDPNSGVCVAGMSGGFYQPCPSGCNICVIIPPDCLTGP